MLGGLQKVSDPWPGEAPRGRLPDASRAGATRALAAAYLDGMWKIGLSAS
jgi:hypothetical protein